MHDNQCRWNGTPGHYEVWYLTGNHRASGTGFWIRYTLEAPHPGHGAPYAQLWFAFFDANHPANNIALNRKFAIEEFTTRAMPFSVRMAGAELCDDSAHGELRGAGHEVAWSLRWQPAPKSHRQLPDVMYLRGGLGETTVLSPNLDVAVSGRITVDGREYELDSEPFGQTHLWGRKHAHAWAWGHCNAFVDRPGAALETLSVTLRRRGVTLPRMTVLSLYLDGHVYRFNQFRHTLLTGAMVGNTRYGFHGIGARFRIEGAFQCRPEDMVVARYEDPDGQPSFCSNTEVAYLEIMLYERSGLMGWREHTRLVAPRTGHFEIGSRTRDPAIAADHICVA